MPDVTASRTLVKSAPELWTECSDAGSLGRHLDGFGDIRITRLEPETAVAWEGEHARGTVRLEPSGWGTRVVLTATPEAALAPAPADVAPGPPGPPGPEPVAPEPEPVAGERRSVAAGHEPVTAATSPARPGFLARLLGRFRRPPVVAEPEPPGQPDRVSAPVSPPEPAAEAPDTQAALLAALDSLGQAHHRPFSRT